MIADLNKQLAGKKDEIARLRESLDKMGVEVEVLTEQVAEQNARAENLSSEKVELENQLHTVYYIVGVEKELRDAQIIDKQGFIGRTLTVNNTNNLEFYEGRFPAAVRDPRRPEKGDRRHGAARGFLSTGDGGREG